MLCFAFVTLITELYFSSYLDRSQYTYSIIFKSCHTINQSHVTCGRYSLPWKDGHNWGALKRNVCAIYIFRAPPEFSCCFHTSCRCLFVLLTLVYAEKDNSLGMSGTSLMRNLKVENGFTLQEGGMDGKETCHTSIRHTWKSLLPFLFYSLPSKEERLSSIPKT